MCTFPEQDYINHNNLPRGKIKYSKKKKRGQRNHRPLRLGCNFLMFNNLHYKTNKDDC